MVASARNLSAAVTWGVDKRLPLRYLCALFTLEWAWLTSSTKCETRSAKGHIMAHPMMLKARCGLEEADRLRADAHLCDGAASRLYYAVYHAFWAFLKTRREPVPFNSTPPPEGKSTHYSHGERLLNILLDHDETDGASGVGWRTVLTRAHRYRIKADYERDLVDKAPLDWLAPKAREVIETLYKYMEDETS